MGCHSSKINYKDTYPEVKKCENLNNQTKNKKSSVKNQVKGKRIGLGEFFDDVEIMKEILDEISYFSFEGLEFTAFCFKVYDGDTIHVVFDTFGQFKKHKIRLIGINTPEIRTKDPEEKSEGLKARDYLSNIILNKKIILKCYGYGKYGRILGRIYTIKNNKKKDIDLNQHMIDEGLAVEYMT